MTRVEQRLRTYRLPPDGGALWAPPAATGFSPISYATRDPLRLLAQPDFPKVLIYERDPPARVLVSRC